MGNHKENKLIFPKIKYHDLPGHFDRGTIKDSCQANCIANAINSIIGAPVVESDDLYEAMNRSGSHFETKNVMDKFRRQTGINIYVEDVRVGTALKTISPKTPVLFTINYQRWCKAQAPQYSVRTMQEKFKEALHIAPDHAILAYESEGEESTRAHRIFDPNFLHAVVMPSSILMTIVSRIIRPLIFYT